MTFDLPAELVQLLNICILLLFFDFITCSYI